MAAPIVAQTSGFLGVRPTARRPQRSVVGRSSLKVRAGPYDEELISTAVRRPVPTYPADYHTAAGQLQRQGTRLFGHTH